jgi:hypothetical protein
MSTFKKSIDSAYESSKRETVHALLELDVTLSLESFQSKMMKSAIYAMMW